MTDSPRLLDAPRAALQFSVALLVLIGCGDESVATPESALDVAPDAVDPGDTPAEDTTLAPTTAVARITALVPTTLEVGETATLKATALDESGSPVETRELFWTSTTPSGLSVTPNGVATALREGLHGAIAYHRGVQAETQWIRVTDPAAATRKPVVLTYDAGAGRVLEWPQAQGTVAGETPVTLSLPETKNALLIGLDPETDSPVLLTLGSGGPPARAGGTPGAVHADFETTAHAIVMITGQLPLESPAAAAAVWTVMAEVPAATALLTEALAQLSSSGGSWLDHRAELATLVAPILARLDERIAALTTPVPRPASSPGKADSGAASTPVKVVVSPGLPVMGIDVDVAACDPLPSDDDLRAQCDAVSPLDRAGYVAMKIKNTYSRWLVSQLTAANGERKVGPIVQGGRGYIPGVFEAIVSGIVDGDSNFVNDSNAFRLFPRALVSGKETLELHVVGWGAEPWTIRGGRLKPSDHRLLAAMAWTYSLVFNVVLPIVSTVLAGAETQMADLALDSQRLDDFISNVGDILGAVGVIAPLSDEALEVDTAIAGLLDAVWGAFLEESALDWLNSITPPGAQGLGEALGKALVVWNITAAVVNVGVTLWDYFVSSRGTAFHIAEAAKIEPTEPTLPTAYEGCQYGFYVDASQLGGDDWQWTVTWDPKPKVGGWLWAAEGEGKRRLWVYRTGVSGLPGTMTRGEDQTRFTITLLQTATEGFAHQAVYILPVEAAFEAPRIEPPWSLSAAPVSPGQPLQVEVQLRECHATLGSSAKAVEVPGLTDGTLTSSSPWGLHGALFTGPAAATIPDGIAPPGARRVRVQLTSGDWFEARAPLHEVKNLPPVVAVTPARPGGGAHEGATSALPGGLVDIQLTINDPNLPLPAQGAEASPASEVPTWSMRARAPGSPLLDEVASALVFAYEPTPTAAGYVAVPRDNAPLFRLPLGLADTDGPAATDAPLAVTVAVPDDDGATPTAAPVLYVTVENAPPEVQSAPAQLAVDASSPAVVTVPVVAADDNGAGDLGSLDLVVLEPAGVTIAQLGATVHEVENTGLTKSFELRFDTSALRLACAQTCELSVHAEDRDDGLYSAGHVLTIVVDGYGPCSTDADCAPACHVGDRLVAFSCVSGACKPASVTACQDSGRACHGQACRASCTDASDCSAVGSLECADASSLRTWMCEGGYCYDSVQACAAGEVCPETSPGCRLPCALTGIPCAPTCDGDGKVVARSCVAGYCEAAAGSATACDAGTVCHDGQCLRPCSPLEPCATSEKVCSEDETSVLTIPCEDGYCRPAVLQVCAAPDTCQQGSCVPPFEQCTSDSDCSPSPINPSCTSSASRVHHRCEIPVGASYGACAIETLPCEGLTICREDGAITGYGYDRCLPLDCTSDADCYGAGFGWCDGDELWASRCQAGACQTTLIDTCKDTEVCDALPGDSACRVVCEGVDHTMCPYEGKPVCANTFVAEQYQCIMGVCNRTESNCQAGLRICDDSSGSALCVVPNTCNKPGDCDPSGRAERCLDGETLTVWECASGLCLPANVACDAGGQCAGDADYNGLGVDRCLPAVCQSDDDCYGKGTPHCFADELRAYRCQSGQCVHTILDTCGANEVCVRVGDVSECQHACPGGLHSECPFEGQIVCANDFEAVAYYCNAGACQRTVVNCQQGGKFCDDTSGSAKCVDLKPCVTASDCDDLGRAERCHDVSTLTVWECAAGACLPTLVPCGDGATCVGDAEYNGQGNDRCLPPVCQSDLDCYGKGSPHCFVDEVRAYRCQAGECVHTTLDTCSASEVCHRDGGVSACRPACPGGKHAECPHQGALVCADTFKAEMYQCILGICEVFTQDCSTGGRICDDADGSAGCVEPAPCTVAAECDPQGIAGRCIDDATLLEWSCTAGKCVAQRTACGVGETCLRDAALTLLGADRCAPTQCQSDQDCFGVGIPRCQDGHVKAERCIAGACVVTTIETCPADEPCVAPYGVPACHHRCPSGDKSECPGGGNAFCADPFTLEVHFCIDGLCIPGVQSCQPEGKVCGDTGGTAACVPPGACTTAADCDPDGLEKRCFDEDSLVAWACDGGKCAAPLELCGAGERCRADGTELGLGADRCAPSVCSGDQDCPGQGSPICHGGDAVIYRCASGACTPELHEQCEYGSTCDPHHGEATCRPACPSGLTAECPGSGDGVCLNSFEIAQYACDEGACVVNATIDCQTQGYVCAKSGTTAQCQPPPECVTAADCDPEGKVERCFDSDSLTIWACESGECLATVAPCPEGEQCKIVAMGGDLANPNYTDQCVNPSTATQPVLTCGENPWRLYHEYCTDTYCTGDMVLCSGADGQNRFCSDGVCTKGAECSEDEDCKDVPDFCSGSAGRTSNDWASLFALHSYGRAWKQICNETLGRCEPFPAGRTCQCQSDSDCADGGKTTCMDTYTEVWQTCEAGQCQTHVKECGEGSYCSKEGLGIPGKLAALGCTPILEGLPCDTGLIGKCAEGVRWGSLSGPYCKSVSPPTEEICNGLDDDCDGAVDEGLAPPGQPCVEPTPCDELDPSACQVTGCADADHRRIGWCEGGYCRSGTEPCDEGELCSAGSCIRTTCQHDGHCLEVESPVCESETSVKSLRCNAGQCVPVTTTCGDGERCEVDECVFAECGSDLDCPYQGQWACEGSANLAQHTCDVALGRCTTLRAGCPAPLECRDGACKQPACSSDAACAVDQPRCNLEGDARLTYRCDGGDCLSTEQACPAATRCDPTQGLCLAPPCAGDADCPDGGAAACSDDQSAVVRVSCDPAVGTCREIVTPCASSDRCEGGVCVTPPECTTDADCPGGGVPACSQGQVSSVHCDAGACEPVSTPCPSGERCENGVCVETECQSDGDCVVAAPSCASATAVSVEVCDQGAGTCSSTASPCPPGEQCISGECAAPPQGCCAVGSASGCAEAACESCVCASRPECCSGAWGPECLALAAGPCEATCGCGGGCCEPQPSGKTCTSPSCVACVGDVVPACLEGTWGSACASAAATACAEVCPCGQPGCTTHDGAGAEPPACAACVCATDPSCCTDAWTEACAALAHDDDACRAECGCQSCCEAGEGCDHAPCRDAVCSQRPECCQGYWDPTCAALAETACPVLCPPPPPTCATHADCVPFGLPCMGGECVPGPSCVVDADCPDAGAAFCAGTTRNAHFRCEATTCVLEVADCDAGETCEAGTCAPCHDTLDCDDGIACTADACDPESGCLPPSPDSAACAPPVCGAMACVSGFGCAVASEAGCPVCPSTECTVTTTTITGAADVTDATLGFEQGSPFPPMNDSEDELTVWSVPAQPYEARAVIEVRLDPALSGRTIEKATLQLRVYGTTRTDGKNAPWAITMHRLLRPFDEPTVTWNDAATGQPWASPGASASGTDRLATPDATFAVTLGLEPNLIDLDVTDAVRASLASGAGSIGWIFTTEKAALGQQLRVSFLHSENQNGVPGPQLILETMPGCCGADPDGDAVPRHRDVCPFVADPEQVDSDGDGRGDACVSMACAGQSGCAPRCGDGVLDVGETCDDGDQEPGDGCDAGCTLETGWTCPAVGDACEVDCGDGLILGAEACDDGNDDDSDCCRNDCTPGPGCAAEPDDTCATAGLVTLGSDRAGYFHDSADVDQYVFVLDAVSDLAIATFDGGGSLGDSCAPPVDTIVRLLRRADGATCTELLKADYFNQQHGSNCESLDAAGSTALRQLPPGEYVVSVAPYVSAGAPFTEPYHYVLRVDRTAVCGDGVKEGAELCDGEPGCEPDCTFGPECGDGAVDPGEACDDGNDDDADCCRNDCSVPSYCDLEPNDTCADAVPLPLDAPTSGWLGHAGDLDSYLVTLTSSADLAIATWDSGGAALGTCDAPVDTVVVVRSRAADGTCTTLFTEDYAAGPDGSNCESIDATTHAALRQLPAGDYVIQVRSYIPPFGTPPTPYRYTVAAWATATCGDGVREGGETCDGVPDCGPDCRFADGCGDGELDAGEGCDDGDRDDGDGCSASCQLEGGVIAEVEPNDLCTSNAQAVTLPATILGQSANSTDHDYYRFTLATRADVRLATTDATGAGCAAPVDTAIQLRAANCTTVLTTRDNFGASGTCEDIGPASTAALRQLPAGTYFVRVSGWDTPWSYRLHLEALTTCGNGVKEGYEACDGDAGCLPDCTIETTCGNGIIDSGELCDDGNTALGDGCSNQCLFEFTLESEPNDTVAMADPINFASQRRADGVLTGTDVDHFKWTLPSPSVIRAELFGPNGSTCSAMASTTLTLIGPDGVTVVTTAAGDSSADGGGIATCPAFTLFLGVPGAYTVRVSSPTPLAIPLQYQLEVAHVAATVLEAEDNGTVAKATTVPSAWNTVLMGAHPNATDVDWFTLTVPEGRSLRVEQLEGAGETCESGELDARLTLTGADGTTILATDDDDGRGLCALLDGTGGTSQRDSGAAGLPAGTYRLKLDSATKASGSAAVFQYRVLVTIR